MTARKKLILKKPGFIIAKRTLILKYSFFGLLKFDYLVLDIDSDYQWVAVGVPSQRYLWVMARQPEIPDSKLEEILSRMESMGY